MQLSKCMVSFTNFVRKKREKFDEFLSTVQILQTMDPYERSKINDALKEETFEKDQYIIREGDNGNTFYFIVEGTAIATKRLSGSKDFTTVMDYSSGQYFGERALLTHEVRAANIVVTSEKVRVLTLDAETFIRLLGPLEELLKRNMDIYNKYI